MEPAVGFSKCHGLSLRLLALMPSSREKLRQEVGIGGWKTMENARNVLKPTAERRRFNKFFEDVGILLENVTDLPSVFFLSGYIAGEIRRCKVRLGNHLHRR